MGKINPVLSIDNITKSYGSIDALKNVHIDFSGNKIYGLFGRNGAGKTTLLDIIASRIFADKGNVIYLGKDITKHPEIIAKDCCYMPEKHYFPGSLKVKTLLSYAQMSFSDYNVQTEERLCQIFKLNTDQKYKDLSRGFQSIFRIVCGLASTAPITIFDEPVLGLDAVARDQFYQELIETFTGNPRLYIISTHFIEESADLFNEAIIIHKGQILRQAPVASLLSNAFYVSGNSSRVNTFVEKRTIIGIQTINDQKTAVVEGDLHSEPPSQGLRFSPLTIQKLFIHLTNNQIQQELKP